MAASNPHKELLELLVQWAAWPTRVKSQSLKMAARLLSDERIAWNVRRQAAVRLLRLVPDRLRFVRPLVRALTRGLPRRQVWECLRWLQEEVPRCEALDRWVARWERRRRWRCPRCPLRFPLADFVRHLWNDHGLIFDASPRRAYSPRYLLSTLWRRWRQSHDPQWLDQAWVWGGETALRGWLRYSGVQAEDLRPLLQQAAQVHSGLCPTCFAQLPASAPPEWPLLTLTPRRLSTVGWAVEYSPGPWWEVVSIQTPQWQTLLRLRPAARLWACLAALSVAGLLFSVLPPSGAMVALPLVSVLVYGLVRYLLRSTNPPQDLLIDTAWQYLVPQLQWSQQDHLRWLIRLCQTSIGRGDPEKRRGTLQYILSYLQKLDDQGNKEQWRLRGVAEWLQWCDTLPSGVDRSQRLLTLLSPAFQGEVPWSYAEAVAAAYLSHPVEYGSLLRVQVLLCQQAFSWGWTPEDLHILSLALPTLGQLLTPPASQRWQHLYSLHQQEIIPAWSSGIVNVFECAQLWPYLTARLLVDYPDLLWIERWDSVHEAALGPILITARGVSLAGYWSLNPEADIRLIAKGYGLMFDNQALYTVRPLPPDLPERLRDWLKILNDFLQNLPAEPPSTPALPQRLLSTLAQCCPHCHTTAIIPRGGIGRKLILSQ
jgi:hypothetical protein